MLQRYRARVQVGLYRGGDSSYSGPTPQSLGVCAAFFCDQAQSNWHPLTSATQFHCPKLYRDWPIHRWNYTQTDELSMDQWRKRIQMTSTMRGSGKRKREIMKKGREWKEDLWGVVERERDREREGGRERERERERERDRERERERERNRTPKNSSPYHSECQDIIKQSLVCGRWTKRCHSITTCKER